jgi:hypothetical protein
MGSVVESIGNAVGIDLGGSGAKDGAIRTADQATRAAEDFAKDQYTIEREAYNPYSLAGQNALRDMTSGNFQADPGYQFRLNQGLSGINSSLAARGMANSGAALKALNQYNQNYASNEYGNWWNRQSGLAGMGFNAAQGLGGAARAYGNRMGDLQLGRANANAAAESAYQGRLSGIAGQFINAGAAAMTGGASMGMPGGGPGGGMTAQAQPSYNQQFTGINQGFQLPNYASNYGGY